MAPARPGAGHPAPAPPPTLADGAIRLRPHRSDDLTGLLEQVRDPQTRRWTDVPDPCTADDAGAWLAGRGQEWAARRTLSLAVQADGRYAGSVALAPDGAGAAGFDVVLAPWARGRGWAALAARLLLGWGFRELDLAAVHANVRVGNWAGRRVCWAAGLRVEGTVRAWLPAPAAQAPGRSDAWVASVLRGQPLAPAHPWLTPPVLTGPPRLRAHTAADAPRMAQACADPRTQHWLALLPTPYRLQDAHEHLADIGDQQAAGRGVYWAIADDDDTLLGEIGVFGLAAAQGRECEIGYWMHPDARGRGVMTAALGLTLRHALLPVDVGGLGLARAVVRVPSGNTASRRVAQSAGMREAGVDREATELRDASVDDLVRYDLVADELEPAARRPVVQR